MKQAQVYDYHPESQPSPFPRPTPGVGLSALKHVGGTLWDTFTGKRQLRPEEYQTGGFGRPSTFKLPQRSPAPATSPLSGNTWLNTMLRQGPTAAARDRLGSPARQPLRVTPENQKWLVSQGTSLSNLPKYTPGINRWAQGPATDQLLPNTPSPAPQDQISAK
jgi:hypothetical protein